MKKGMATFDQELGATVGKFIGFFTHEEFTEVAHSVLRLMAKNNPNKVLVDTEQIRVMTFESQLWIDTVWFPKAKNLGLKKIAFLTPRDIFGQVSVRNSNKTSEDLGIEVKYFDKLTTARSWINEK
jgi:hypothetical protein